MSIPGLVDLIPRSEVPASSYVSTRAPMAPRPGTRESPAVTIFGMVPPGTDLGCSRPETGGAAGTQWAGQE